MNKGTPTPWTVGTKPSDPRGWSPYLYGGADGREIVAKLPSGQRAEPDADLIVRAVNAHEALVSALRGLLGVELSSESLRGEGYRLRCRFCGNTSAHAEKCPTHAARAALALAEGSDK